MISTSATRALFSLAAAAAVSAAICLTGEERSLRMPTSGAPVQVASARQTETGETVWERFLAPTSDLLPGSGTALEFRSLFASRGLAASSFLRPVAVLASYQDPRQHTGESLTNARTAMLALDRVVIPPASELSFNRTVGPRYTSRGYEAGLMFNKGQVVWGVGGGVCIASTALYNAALLAGLPIIERWMHSGAVSYAEASRDAAVVYGSKDLVIKNNTPYPIWVRAIVEDGYIRVSLLSSAPGTRRVVLKTEGTSFIPCPLEMVPGEPDKPEVVKEGSPGCDVRLYRAIYEGSKLVKREQICHDVRKPQPRVIAVANAVAGAEELTAPGTLSEPISPELKLPPVQQPPQVAPEPLPVPE